MHVCVTRVVRVTEPATIGRLRCNARSIELHADMLTCCCCVAGVGARAPAGPPARLWADASPCSRTPGGPLRPHSTACCKHRACSGPQAICRRKVLVTSISECLKTVHARTVPARLIITHAMQGWRTTYVTLKPCTEWMRCTRCQDCAAHACAPLSCVLNSTHGTLCSSCDTVRCVL